MFTHAHHNFHRGRWRRRLGRGCEGWALPSLSGRGGERATGSAGQVNRVTDEPALRSIQSVSLWIGQDSSASFRKRGNQNSELFGNLPLDHKVARGTT